ncbi:retrovirus-related Pol polyprotein from transposon RE2 [Cannabis sativa]|uniref:retrovirus-related Pol polyprotein from transposon RE2 n=1 Tax=Cannabis sativa TaxID=3483 RepID=UPI0029CA29BE|nr:retrovirus-related Pol polyprotein from transposon RE2 [Cannabis sativa]
MREKSEVEQIFTDFYKMIENQFQTKISILRTDNGTEYFNHILGNFLKEKGILHQSTCPDTPEQNGIAERKNKHLLEVARAMMFYMNVPKYLWGDAVLTASYLINRMPTKVLHYTTPLKCFKKFFPTSRINSDLPLKIFGSTVFVHLPKMSRSKLDPRAEKCIFLGYPPNKKGYKCFNPISKRIYITMDVSFAENSPYFSKNFVQGENSVVQNFWELVEPLPKTILDVSLEKTQPTSIESESDLGLSETEMLRLIKNRNVLEPVVYSRKNIWERSRDHPIIPAQDQMEAPNNGSSSTPSNSSSIPRSSLSPSNILSSQSVSSPTSETLDLPIALRKGTRACTKHPIAKYISYNHLSDNYRAFITNISELVVPRSIQEALDEPRWKLAVDEEMDALIKNGTWEIVMLPRDKKIVGCKRVFTVKFKVDGSIERFKARLVAKGFTQTYRIDYQETFAPVAKINSIRILLSLAVNYNWPLNQLDVKNAFLNGDLEEEVYMSVPPGFEKKFGVGKVCKLKKSLYGLKQSPRAWFERFGKVLKRFGYTQSQADHTMFYKHSEEGKVAILIVYVDDIVITGDDIDEQERLKRRFGEEFEIKDLGPLKYFLGMEFARSKEGIFVSQRKYVLDLLNETGMMGCKPAETPSEPNVKLQAVEDLKSVKDKELYQRLVERLINLSHTRPDIAFSVSMVSQFMHSPGSRPRGHLEIEAYTDADWAGSTVDRRSTSGYCSYVGGNLVTWQSKKQSVVARSSAEAEFRSVAHGICEIIWIKRLLEELKSSQSSPMKLYCDNKAAIAIAHNPVLHDRTKHVEVDKHFTKEKIESGQVCMPYVSSEDQVADIFTKGLCKKQFDFLTSKLAMENIFSPA